MSITVLAHLPFRPDAMDEGMKVLEEILPDTRAFEGCLSLTVHRDQDAPHEVVLIEQWRSTDDHKAYMSWRAETGSSAGMRSALGGAPSIQYLEHVSTF